MATQRKGENKLHSARKNQLKRCTVKKDILTIEKIIFVLQMKLMCLNFHQS